MKQALFISSHLGSNYFHLFEALKKEPRIDGYEGNLMFNNFEVLYEYLNQPHKRGASSDLYMSNLLYNHSFSCRSLCKYCKFVYLFGNPRVVISNIIKDHIGYSKKSALRYYQMRLQGMYQYICRSPNSCILFHDDYSELKSHFNLYLEPPTEPEVESDYFVDECCREYDNVSTLIKQKQREILF